MKKKNLHETDTSPEADTGNDPIKLRTPITIPPVFQSIRQKFGACNILLLLFFQFCTRIIFK